MIANHIHDALGQVDRLQQVLLERRRFHGYSGAARLVCGSLAILGAAVMSRAWYPHGPWYQLAGWGAVLGLGLAINYGCLLYWFLFDETARRQPVVLKPAIDAVPALAVGAVLSAGLILRGHFDMLFGVWMCLYGLAQVAYRMSLPSGVYWAGLWYIAAGCVCLLPPLPLLKPLAHGAGLPGRRMGWRAGPLPTQTPATQRKKTMTTGPAPYDALERIFHEPKRLAIMSTLAAAESPLSFVELKTECGLTDGNLNRHLQVLADEGVINISKAFVDAKPRTSLSLSAAGLRRFSEYLAALRSVLKQAQNALPEEAPRSVPLAPGARRVKA